jgi:hypothetical protein
MKSLIFAFSILCLLETQAQSTTLSSSWRDPETLVKMGQFNKVLVVALVKNKATRRIVEDDIIKILKSKGIASYQYLGEESNSMSTEELSEKIKTDEFDGAIVMRLIDPSKDLSHMPGTGIYPAYYKDFYPYYKGAASSYHDENYTSSRTSYAVETNMYSLKENKLIWNGITNTVDPKNLDKMVEAIGKVITKEMKKQGFLY